ncbi:MAG: flagellar protein FlaG [Firmicutes bacterium]|nr:flagellar protein FlaG [Bacillota bacterium]
MRVERIQPEIRQAEGSVVKNHVESEQGKLLEPFLSPFSRAAQQAKEEGREEESSSLARLEEKINQLNETVEIFHKRIHFQIHKETNRIMVQVIEKATNEVISVIPPEKILDLVARIEEMIGLFVDERV